MKIRMENVLEKVTPSFPGWLIYTKAVSSSKTSQNQYWKPFRAGYHFLGAPLTKEWAKSFQTLELDLN